MLLERSFTLNIIGHINAYHPYTSLLPLNNIKICICLHYVSNMHSLSLNDPNPPVLTKYLTMLNKSRITNTVYVSKKCVSIDAAWAWGFHQQSHDAARLPFHNFLEEQNSLGMGPKILSSPECFCRRLETDGTTRCFLAVGEFLVSNNFIRPDFKLTNKD